MEPSQSNIQIALENSNRCHNEKYMERLLDSPALKYNKEFNYIYLTLPRGEEHMVDRDCIDEYYSWLTEYLRDEIFRLETERDKIKVLINNNSDKSDNIKKIGAEEKQSLARLLINPSDEQIQNMIGFDPRKDKSLLITDKKLLIALRQGINGNSSQMMNELLDEIEMIYKKRIEKITEMIVKYENVLMKFKEKITDLEANKRIFKLRASNVNRECSDSSSNNNNKSKSKKKRKGKKKKKKGNKYKSKLNNNNNNNNNK